jgi:hypothetical protein
MSRVHPVQRLLRERSPLSSTSILRRNPHQSIRLRESITTVITMGIDDVDGIEMMSTRTARESLGETVRGDIGMSLLVLMCRMRRLTFPHVLMRRDAIGLMIHWRRSWKAFCRPFSDSVSYLINFLSAQGLFHVSEFGMEQ